MSKAAQILALYDGKRSCRAIGDIVGCSDSYVRVVARQRKGGVSDIDQKYRAKVIAKGDRAKARAAARAVYRAARRAGLDWRKARNKSGTAYMHKMRATGAKALRREREASL
jgi:hypothetical protein